MPVEMISDKVSLEDVGHTFHDKVLLDILPKGTRFEVVDIQLQKHCEMGNSVLYYIRPAGGFDKRGPKLDARFITQGRWSDNDLTTIDPAIARRVEAGETLGE